MHFWIDKRASQLQYGRRRPGTFYASRPSGLGRDKTLSSSSASSTTTSGGGTSSSSSSSGSSNNNRNNGNGRRGIFTDNNVQQGVSRIQQEYSNNAHHQPPQSSNSNNNNGRIHREHHNGSSRSDGQQNSNNNSGLNRHHHHHHHHHHIQHTRGGEYNNSTNNQLFNQNYMQEQLLFRPHSPLSSSSTSSSTSSGIDDPKWTRTKRIGLTLCFMAFILIGTVAAKLIIEGPSMIDAARGRHEATPYYFLITELVFIVFAVALFFTGVACLRKRTNQYLLRQFQQHILTASSGATTVRASEVSGGSRSQSQNSTHPPLSGSVAGDNFLDFTTDHSLPPPYRSPNFSVVHHPSSDPGSSSTSATTQCHHHHHLMYSNNNNGNSAVRAAAVQACPHYTLPTTAAQQQHPHLGTFQSPRTDVTVSHGNNTVGGQQQRISAAANRRHNYYAHRHYMHDEMQEPPPYHIALYLPLPKEVLQDDDENDAEIINSEKKSKMSQDGEDIEEIIAHTRIIMEEEQEGGVQDGRNCETPPPSYDEFAIKKV